MFGLRAPAPESRRPKAGARKTVSSQPPPPGQQWDGLAAALAWSFSFQSAFSGGQVCSVSSEMNFTTITDTLRKTSMQDAFSSVADTAVRSFSMQHWSSSVNEREVPFTVPTIRRLQSDDRASSEGRIAVGVPSATAAVSPSAGTSSTSIDGGSNSTFTRNVSPLPQQLMSNTSVGTLNPDLYKSPEEGDIYEYPEGHIGRIWFTVDYDRSTEKLVVTLSKARNLPSRDLTNPNACDPFVRLVVLPDERRVVESKVKRRSVNPNFGDAFTFEVSKESFDERTLKLTALDVDAIKRHIPIGTVLFPLKDYTLCKQQKLTLWRDLKRSVNEQHCQLGELNCSMSYNPAKSSLTISLIEAKDLKPPEDTDGIDCFAKVVFSVAKKQLKTKKTKVIKRTLNPAFGETMDFKLPADKIDLACLSVQVMQLKQRQIGRVILGGPLHTTASGKQRDHWHEMVTKAPDVAQSWHYLTE